MNLFKSEHHAIKLLKSDHQKVDALFEAFENASGNAEKVDLVNQICQELSVHAEIEEKVFYPDAMRALGQDSEDMINEASVEHATLKGLIVRLDGMSPDDELFKAYVMVLKEYVQHHVKEEESEMFPKIEKTDLDLEAVGEQLVELKDSLQTDIAAAGEPAKGAVHAPSLVSAKATESTRKHAV